MDKSFQWQDFSHFRNTVRKRIKEQLGNGFEFKTGDKPTFVLELPELCDFIKLAIVEK